MRNANAKQVNVVMSDAEKAELSEFCQNNNISINEAMNRARELLLVDSLKSMAPDQSSMIEDFELLVNKILQAYRHSIERSLEADSRAEAKVQSQLEGIASLVNDNKDLHTQLYETKTENEKLKKALTEITEQKTQLEQKLQEANSVNANNEDLENQIISMKQELVDLKLQHVNDLEKIRTENYEKILEVIKVQCNQMQF